MKVLTLVSVATALVAPRAVCPQSFVPVCGVDGNTYNNDCYLANAGVAKAHDGTCEDVPTTTSTTTTTATTPTTSGDFPTGIHRPPICYALYAPVCGVDGSTYGNDCYLNHARVAKAHEGSCEDEVVPTNTETTTTTATTTTTRLVLETGGYEYPPICYDLFDPICGVDGVTYGNDCYLSNAGVAKAYKGKCGSVL